MRGKGSQVLGFLVGLTIVFTLVWLTYLLGRTVVSGLASLESDVAVAIVAASITGLVSVITLTLSKRLETQAAIRQEIREKKIPIYEELMSVLFKTLLAEKIGEEKPTEQELMQFIAGFTEKLIVWGSDGVVAKYEEFKNAANRDVSPTDMMFIYEDLLLEIRKDLGHSNRNLGRGKLLSLFITDIDEYLPERKTRGRRAG